MTSSSIKNFTIQIHSDHSPCLDRLPPRDPNGILTIPICFFQFTTQQSCFTQSINGECCFRWFTAWTQWFNGSPNCVLLSHEVMGDFLGFSWIFQSFTKKWCSQTIQRTSPGVALKSKSQGQMLWESESEQESDPNIWHVLLEDDDYPSGNSKWLLKIAVALQVISIVQCHWSRVFVFPLTNGDFPSLFNSPEAKNI